MYRSPPTHKLSISFVRLIALILIELSNVQAAYASMPSNKRLPVSDATGWFARFPLDLPGRIVLLQQDTSVAHTDLIEILPGIHLRHVL